MARQSIMEIKVTVWPATSFAQVSISNISALSHSCRRAVAASRNVVWRQWLASSSQQKTRPAMIVLSQQAFLFADRSNIYHSIWEQYNHSRA